MGRATGAVERGVRLLLDTHVLLWALADPRRLSTTAASLLRNPANFLLVSAASAWEVATKQRLGRLPDAEAIVGAYRAHLDILRAEELPISSAHALRAGGFRVKHRDPFDRMLAAQALLEGVPLMTDDPAFARFAGLQLVW